MLAYIPLRLLHDFFEKLNYPVINLRHEFALTTAMAPTCQYPPLSVGFLLATAVTQTACQVNVISSCTLPGAPSSCRLYYRELSFQPAIADLIKTKLSAGFHKEFSYIDTNTYPKLNNTSTTIHRNHTSRTTTQARQPATNHR